MHHVATETKIRASTTVLTREWLKSLTADEAGCLQDLFFLLLLTPQVSEGVDDNTKDEVEDNDDDHEEEQQVVYHSGGKQWLLGEEQGHIWSEVIQRCTKVISVQCCHCLFRVSD